MLRVATEAISGSDTDIQIDEIKMTPLQANYVKKIANRVCDAISKNAQTEQVNYLEREVKKALDIEKSSVTTAFGVASNMVLKRADIAMINEMIDVLGDVSSAIDKVTKTINDMDVAESKAKVEAAVAVEALAKAKAEAPLYTIGSPVYVKRSNGSESFAFVKEYDANSKLYTLELDRINSGTIKQCRVNAMRSVPPDYYPVNKSTTEELRALDDDEKEKNKLEYQARLMGDIGIGEQYTSLRSKTENESRATAAAERRLRRSKNVYPDSKTEGGRNTKKYYRRHKKRKTKHYKKKTKRYTKKKNMRY